ncbi:PP2C family protein-serine/threonine phosphatase [Aestuariivirga sp.]|jgi:sigma-B regulation protein RsbU (phosphoserine phosphatase)|uniref:PP2C family protein-serine/threonine phosphatase n=1 Tax=Aestuariivirga sp. TaxID=2650926 RepID=UPI003784CE77
MTDLEQRLAASEAELERVRAEFEDLNLLYQATIEHGEAVEDQLAEANLELQRTQKRLSEELTEAANYIFSILPTPRQAAPHTEWLLEPSTELGGDSFGYHDIDADHIALYLLDVCGHGVGAALLSVTAINVLRSGALPNTDFREPGQVLSALNEAFPMEKQHNMYFTIWYGVYQRSTGSLRYASAGHPPSVLRKADGRVLTLSTPGIAIGMMPDMMYRTAHAEIGMNDRLHLVSDGTFEVETAPGEMLAFETFVSRLSESSSPAEVLDWVRAINGPGPLPDDFSLLTVSF